MRTLHPHQRRPKIYHTIGFGWSTDRWYDQKIARTEKELRISH